MGLRVARKHIGWYFQGSDGGETFRRSFNQLQTTTEQETMIESYFERNEYKELAA